jgi:hypothetical protein
VLNKYSLKIISDPKILKETIQKYANKALVRIKNFVHNSEMALGTKSRGGQQWDIWEAVYSSVGKDGYAESIWDKKTGIINKKVAEYWRENYDLSYILKRYWPKIGQKWKGKIRVYCGDMDN